MFSHVPVHFAILLGFSICLGGGGAGGGDAVRRGFFAAGFFGGAAGMRSSVAPLEMFVMRNAGAFLAAGLREGHCGGAPPPLLPPYMLAQLSTQIAHRSLCVRSDGLQANGCLLPTWVRHISCCPGLAHFCWLQLCQKPAPRQCFSSLLAALKTLAAMARVSE